MCLSGGYDSSPSFQVIADLLDYLMLRSSDSKPENLLIYLLQDLKPADASSFSPERCRGLIQIRGHLKVGMDAEGKLPSPFLILKHVSFKVACWCINKVCLRERLKLVRSFKDVAPQVISLRGSPFKQSPQADQLERTALLSSSSALSS